MMPARETVAGDALRRSSTSKCSGTFGRSIVTRLIQDIGADKVEGMGQRLCTDAGLAAIKEIIRLASMEDGDTGTHIHPWGQEGLEDEMALEKQLWTQRAIFHRNHTAGLSTAPKNNDHLTEYVEHAERVLEEMRRESPPGALFRLPKL